MSISKNLISCLAAFALVVLGMPVVSTAQGSYQTYCSGSANTGNKGGPYRICSTKANCESSVTNGMAVPCVQTSCASSVASFLSDAGYAAAKCVPTASYTPPPPPLGSFRTYCSGSANTGNKGGPYRICSNKANCEKSVTNGMAVPCVETACESSVASFLSDAGYAAAKCQPTASYTPPPPPLGSYRTYCSGSANTGNKGGPYRICSNQSNCEKSVTNGMAVPCLPTACESSVASFLSDADYSAAKCQPTGEPPAPLPVPAGSTGCAVSPSGLIGLWQFSGNGLDAQGNNGVGFKNGTTFSAGMIGQGGGLDGVDDYLDLGSSPCLNFAANSGFTIAGWVKTTDAFGPIYSERSAPELAVLDMMIGADGIENIPGRLMALIRTDGTSANIRITGGVINDGVWHFVSLVRTGATIELFMDAVSQGTATAPSVSGAITASMKTFGSERAWVPLNFRAPDLEYLKASVDEFAIYNRALSPAEIKANYNAGFAGQSVK